VEHLQTAFQVIEGIVKQQLSGVGCTENMYG
jgi:hypothetical protein